jgi:hypothetical protein
MEHNRRRGGACIRPRRLQTPLYAPRRSAGCRAPPLPNEARARTLAEEVLARVLKEGLTDTAHIAVRDWVALGAEHRQAIETRLYHNAAGTEPAPNPDLVDELATEMTRALSVFACRDLVPAIAHLPLPQWQRFRDWQTGIRRNDPTTEDQRYAIKRGLQLANKMVPDDVPDGVATNTRAALVEEIDTWRRISGKTPDDGDLAGILARYVPTEPHTTHRLEWDPRVQPEITPVGFVPPLVPQGDVPGVHRAQANRMTAPSAGALAELRALAVFAERAVIAAQRALATSALRVAEARAALQAIPSSNVAAASAATRALQDATRAFEATAREHAELQAWEADLKAAMVDWGYAFSGQRFPPRISEKNEVAEAARLGFVPTDVAPIEAQGRRVFVNPSTGAYIVRAIDPRTPGAWEMFDANLDWQGFRDDTLQERYPDPPLKQFFPHAVAMTPAEKAQKQYEDRMRKWRQEVAAMKAGGATDDQMPPEPEPPKEDPEEKAKREQEEAAKAETARAAEQRYRQLARKYDMNADSDTTRRVIENLDMDLEDFISKFKKGSIRQEIDSGLRQKGSTVRQALDHATEGQKMQKLLPQKRFDK